MFMNIFKTKDCTSAIIDNDKIEKIRLHVLTSLSSQRYEHSLRVAKTASLLCKHFGENEVLGYYAGLSHDMCKEMDKAELEQVVLANAESLSETEKKKPSLLHGRACAIVLKKQFNIVNEEILEAVSCHTFGKKNMCNIAKIVCIADKIEPGRPYMSSSKMKNLLKLTLDKLLETVLKEIITVRRKKKDEVFPEALWILDKKSKGEKKGDYSFIDVENL